MGSSDGTLTHICSKKELGIRYSFDGIALAVWWGRKEGHIVICVTNVRKSKNSVCCRFFVLRCTVKGWFWLNLSEYLVGFRRSSTIIPFTKTNITWNGFPWRVKLVSNTTGQLHIHPRQNTSKNQLWCTKRNSFKSSDEDTPNELLTRSLSCVVLAHAMNVGLYG